MKTIRDFIDTWNAHHGTADPREMLDRYFWSTRTFSQYDSREVEQWCDQNIGSENWYRMFNKFWFTSESEYVMFRLTWSGEK